MSSTTFGLSESDRRSEKDRLLNDLHCTTDQIRRLEMVLREVANVGPMDLNSIHAELDSRRNLSARRERIPDHDRDRPLLRLLDEISRMLAVLIRRLDCEHQAGMSRRRRVFQILAMRPYIAPFLHLRQAADQPPHIRTQQAAGDRSERAEE